MTGRGQDLIRIPSEGYNHEQKRNLLAQTEQARKKTEKRRGKRTGVTEQRKGGADIFKKSVIRRVGRNRGVWGIASGGAVA